jgi:hypothetical protein
MPAAARLAPAPAAFLSNTSTRAPRAASRQAMLNPMTPPPMMATLGFPIRAKRSVNRRLSFLK